MSTQTATMKQGTRIKISKAFLPTLMVLGILYTIRSHVTDCPPQTILGAWTVLPPVAFIIDYMLFDRKRESKEEFEHFKYVQGLARNLWLGMVMLLAALYLGNWSG